MPPPPDVSMRLLSLAPNEGQKDSPVEKSEMFPWHPEEMEV